METLDPDSISAELAGRDEDLELEQRVPPVVAVVVTNDPGPWLEQCLAALADQDYPALSVLVLDNGSADDPTARIAATMPRAFVRRRSGEGGFAAAANEALASVEGATFLLFCHDDAICDRNALRVMVEEAYRSNAGIVGPKVVDHEHPELLLEVGMAADHYGVPFSGIEPDEIDQEQHDGVRDVFFVSHTAMLVRADLFHELDGFDPAAFPGSDDLDLCWRARLAGARVIVAPSARVRHRRATETEARPARAHPAGEVRAETRARVRVLAKSYSALTLLWVLPVSFVLALGEAFVALVTGRFAKSFAIVRGWFGAWSHPRALRRSRRATQRLRRVDDGEVRDLMIRGSARVREFTTRHLHTSDRFATVSSRTRVRVNEATGRMRRAPAVLGVILGVLVLFGVRGLLFSHVPEVGSFRVWPGVGSAWSTFTSSYRTTFMGSGTVATPAFAAIAGISGALFGHGDLGRSLVVGGALPLGAFGAYRLVRKFAVSALPAVAAAIAFAVNPVVRNAIWRGELGPLVCFALAPFVVGAFVRVVDDATTRRARVHATCTIVILGAISGAVWVPAIGFALLVGVAIALAAPFAGRARASLGALAIGALGSAGAALLLAPWVATLVGADRATLGAQPRAPLTLAEVLTFHTGNAGAGLAGWGVLVAATVPLAIATGPRFSWAARAWTLAVLSFLAAWLPGRVAPDQAWFAPEGILVGAAVGLAFAAGLGVAAVLDDLRRFHFGWRQVVTVVGVIGLAWAFVGFAADTVNGRFGLDSADWPTQYSWMNERVPVGEFRVLWVGDPNILPADAKTAGEIGFATTRNGPEDARASWAAPEGSADRALATALQSAAAGQTARLGHLLAPAGIRYIAFVQRAAPTSGAYGRDESALSNALARQLDLTLSRVDDAGVVYQNDAWIPMHAAVPPSGSKAHIDATDPLSGAVRSEPDGVRPVAVADGRTEPVGPGTLLWSEAASSRWRAQSNGTTLDRKNAFGMTNAFTLPAHAAVRVHYAGAASDGPLHALEIGAWIAVLAAWLVTWRKRARARRPESDGDAGPEVTVALP